MTAFPALKGSRRRNSRDGISWMRVSATALSRMSKLSCVVRGLEVGYIMRDVLVCLNGGIRELLF